MPFANFSSFQDCVNKNQDKRNPQAYCASIQATVEGTKKKEHVNFIENLDLGGKRVTIEENRHLSDRFGDARPDTGEIRINTAKGDVVDTVIHELLHVENPNKPEERVAIQSRRIEKSMSLAEAGMLLLEASQSQKPVEPRKIVFTRSSKIIKNNIK